MSFASMHNDYLDPDKHLWEDEPPCEKCKHDNGYDCDLPACDYSPKEETMTDPVTNPYKDPVVKKILKASKTMIGGDHYTRLDVQPWDAFQSWFPPEHFQSYLLMNAVKYLARDKGNKRQDVEKAKHYLEKWLEVTGG